MKKQQQQQQQDLNNKQHDLLNFHFTPRSPPISNQHSNRQHQSNYNYHRSNSNNNNNNKNKKKSNNTNYQNRRTIQDRTSIRRKLTNTMFPLHTSPDHAFIITRRIECNNNSPGQYEYTYNGPDSAVSWNAVKIVKWLVTATGNNTCCPICLDDDICCSRITKCGHTFCLSCIIHHIQTYNDKTTSPKCPCCSSILDIHDLRPVIIINIISSNTIKSNNSSTTNNKQTFIKLHRHKDCYTPYLPSSKTVTETEQEQQQHSKTTTITNNNIIQRLSPYAAPCMNDVDNMYCRFNYIDYDTYEQLLINNQTELLTLAQQNKGLISQMDNLCIELAVQYVHDQIQKLTNEREREMEWKQQFENNTSGIYHSLPKYLLAENHCERSNTNAIIKDEQPPIYTTATWDDTPAPAPAPDTIVSTNDVVGIDNFLEEQQDDNNNKQQQYGRDRGNSIISHGTITSVGTSGSVDKKNTHTNGGTAFADQDEYAFYQAEDGSLCFLSGFNMNCLRTEYATTIPNSNDDNNNNNDTITDNNNDKQKLPLPDRIEGRVWDIERVNLTPELRSRRRFLGHLPLYIDICFIEISLGHVLSNNTKKIFRKEFEKRKHNRNKKLLAEKRIDEREKRKEEERINALKARMQRIDPNDEFFHISQPEQPVVLTGDEFGPCISGPTAPIQSTSATSTADAATRTTATTTPVVSFSQVCSRAKETSTPNNDIDFPALGSSMATTSTPKRNRAPPPPPPRPWGSSVKTAPPTSLPTSDIISPNQPQQQQQPSSASRKGTKGKKIVLFSTGSHRGGNY